MHEVLTDEKVRKGYGAAFTTAAKASSCTCNFYACGPPRVDTGGVVVTVVRPPKHAYVHVRTRSAATRTRCNEVEPDDTGELPQGVESAPVEVDKSQKCCCWRPFVAGVIGASTAVRGRQVGVTPCGGAEWEDGRCDAGHGPYHVAIRHFIFTGLHPRRD